ncbi:hypothetical protein AVO45_08185 [Ruegeria marisrubri]|uniref:Uncharacterized protein n=1 Tax=Ruegeria marisrubri TaxID=1685379 RepID=A0A0X3TSB8_9RHOB|nr:hypothetical protein AVO45_08185 [Ruegeria marisrubri]
MYFRGVLAKFVYFFVCLVLMGGSGMLRTITLGSCVLVQGMLVRKWPDGRVSVRVGDKIFRGHPVKKAV